MTSETQERDDVLLRRSGRGDEEAFTTLYRRHQGGLFRFALRMTGSAWAAEEVVQEVFMTLIRQPEKYDTERGTLSAFLYGVARNKILKHLERTPRDLPLDETTKEETRLPRQVIELTTPVQVAESNERRNQVWAAVLELPVEFRETVTLCELEEKSYEEAAKILECPVGTIRSRLHRGRALLLAKLEILRANPKRAGAHQ